MGEEKERVFLNGFHSKYTDGVYITWIREKRERDRKKERERDQTAGKIHGL
jgi:hypothetical protein